MLVLQILYYIVIEGFKSTQRITKIICIKIHPNSMNILIKFKILNTKFFHLNLVLHCLAHKIRQNLFVFLNGDKFAYNLYFLVVFRLGESRIRLDFPVKNVKLWIWKLEPSVFRNLLYLLKSPAHTRIYWPTCNWNT